MPITVNCPSCSAQFKTKDEYAGKRAKCPKCGEPLTIPAVVDTVLMPPPAKVAAPVAARPVSASKPKPVADDEADEAPKPKRRRDEDDDDAPVSPKRKRGAADEDDNPRAKKGKGDDKDDRPARKRGASDEDEKPRSRKRGDDADDDKPRSRRRRDDDDEPKKKSKLPLILGILGGLFLLCGGGCAGVYFGVIVPAAEKAKKELDALASDLKNRAGDGDPAKPNVPTPVATLTPDQMAEQHKTYASKHVKLTGRLKGYQKSSGFGGSVGGKTLALYYIFVEGTTKAVTVSATEEGWPAASPPPVGSQVEFVGTVSGSPQQLELNFATLVAHTPPTGGAGGGTSGQPTVLSPDELVRDWQKYQGKTVTVKGPAGFATSSLKDNPGGYDVFFALKPNQPQQVRGRVPAGKWKGQRVLKDAPIEITGRVEGLFANVYVDVVECDLKVEAGGVPAPAGPGTPANPPGEVLTVDALIKDAKKYDGKEVTVSGKVGEVVDLLNPPLINLEGPGDDYLTCSPPPKGWNRVPKVGDTVTLRGRVRLVDRMDGGKGCSFEQCQVVGQIP